MLPLRRRRLAIRVLAVGLLGRGLPVPLGRAIWLLRRRRRRAVTPLLWRRVVLAGWRCGAVGLRRGRGSIWLGRWCTVGLRRGWLPVALGRLRRLLVVLALSGRWRRAVLLRRRWLLVVTPLLLGRRLTIRWVPGIRHLGKRVARRAT